MPSARIEIEMNKKLWLVIVLVEHVDRNKGERDGEYWNKHLATSNPSGARIEI